MLLFGTSRPDQSLASWEGDAKAPAHFGCLLSESFFASQSCALQNSILQLIGRNSTATMGLAGIVVMHTNAVNKDLMKIITQDLRRSG